MICGEIRQCEIRLVTHTGDHGNPRRRHRPGDTLVVERPQILDRAAAAHHKDHVYVIACVQCSQSSDNSRWGGIALHRRRGKQHVGQRVTPCEHVQHVTQGRRCRRRDHADTLREHRQRTLTLRRKQPFGLQFRLESLKLLEERTASGRPDGVDVDLVTPTLLVQANASVNDDLIPGSW